MRLFGVSLILLSTIIVIPAPASAATGTTTRVSVASDGSQANSSSGASAVSGDGRYVAFHSTASNLVPGDTNNSGDVFVQDRDTGGIERVSVASDGIQGNGFSQYPAISADGRYVAFESSARNLVPGDTNNAQDVFVHDRVTRSTERVSLTAGGGQATFFSLAATISGDGRYVAFQSLASNLVPGDTNGRDDVFVRDRVAGTTSRISVGAGGQGNANSGSPAISGDGRYVSFASGASNLVPGDTNGTQDVFVRDRVAGSTARVTVASDGTQANFPSSAPAISSDGRYVAFQSRADNLVPGDSNFAFDVFVHDRVTGSTERVSVASDGSQVEFSSGLEQGQPAISADGRYVAFESTADTLVPDDTNFRNDVFVHDRMTGSTERVTVAGDGTQANGPSFEGGISGDGRYVAFESSADNLVPGDTNVHYDVFVRDREGITPGDTTAPTLSLPDPITAEANSPGGAVVSYTATATDDTDPNPTVACAPASESTFPLGATTVDCTATDASGNQAASSFTVTVVDTTAPTLTLPTDQTTEATGPGGATGSYTATATDTVDPDPTVVCSPASGSIFPLGATTVDCTVTDASGNQAAGSFTVTVIDTTAPALTLPADQTIAATGPGGATGSYTATATDIVDPNPTVSCEPASGSTFPIGATTVDCTGTDATGNHAAGSFGVTVVGAAGQLEDLEALILDYPLKATVEASLLNKITGVQDAVAAGKTHAACSKLADFLGQVADFRMAGKLTDTQANELTGDGTRIRDVLGC